MEVAEWFEHFWDLYPKRKPHANPKATAKAAFERALKRGVRVEQLWDGARGYAEYCKDHGVKPVYVCMASTFLNQDRYEDYADYEPAPQPVNPKPSDLMRMMGLGKR